MATDEDMLLEEKRAFDEIRANLVARHQGKFVLFKDRQIHAVCETYDEAYAAGISAFGVDAVFLIEQLLERPPESISFTWDLRLTNVTT